jgi:hypothetical protein
MANIVLTEQDRDDLKNGVGINALADDGSEVTLRSNDLTFEQQQNLDRGEPVTVTIGGVEHTLRLDEDAEPAIVVRVTRSSGPDGAVLVMIDTTFLPVPDADEPGPGLRVLVNDEPVFAGVAFQPPGESDLDDREANHRSLEVRLADIDYTDEASSPRRPPL